MLYYSISEPKRESESSSDQEEKLLPAQEAVELDNQPQNDQMPQPIEEEKEPEQVDDEAVIEMEDYELQDEFMNQLIADAHDSEQATSDELARVEQSTRWVVPQSHVSRQAFLIAK